MSAFVVASNLAIEYRTALGAIRALDGADLRIEAGSSMGLVGESGSGKTTLGMAMGRLLPANAKLASGSLTVASQPLFELDDERLVSLRRSRLGFVFQSPMSALNPTARIGKQISWALGRKPSESEVHELLRQVGLREAHRIARAYPNELSGGMAQRVVIAMAIARRPELLVADEPTASLDASIRGQILELIISLQHAIRATLVLLSHELSTVARTCDAVGVMYGGRVVETGPASIVFKAPQHPYTQGLLKAALGAERPGERLAAIPGAPPVLTSASPGCSFAARCGLADEACRNVRPDLRPFAGREVACHHAGAVLQRSESFPARAS